MTPNLRLRYAFFERLFATRMRRMAAMTPELFLCWYR